MRITFYVVNVDQDDGMEGEIAAATLEHARDVRRAQRHPYGAVTKITTPDLPPRELARAIFNREGYAEDSQPVLPARPERKDDFQL